MEDCESGYNARSVCQTAELVQVMFDYVAYSGDAGYLKNVVAPWLKEAALFYLSWLKREDDGLYHATPSDAIEMWWKVKDPMTDLCAIRYILWQTLAHGEAFGYERALMTAVKERAERLAPFPTGVWRRRAIKEEERPPGSPSYYSEILDTIELTDKYYAPAADVFDDRIVHNMENPELYIVYPLALVDANSSAVEYERAVRTFKARQHPNSAGWSQCPIQAARLRLPDAVDIIMDHARKHQRYPYGGWISPAAALAGSKTGASDTPYLDAAGVNCTALEEALLQSHHLTTPEKVDPFGTGPIVVLPAVRKEWSGSFTLRSRGGFIVSAVFRKNKKLEKVTVESERGGMLTLVNPFFDCQVMIAGKAIGSSKDAVLSVPTKAGDMIEFTGRRETGKGSGSKT
jgi:hypothetical protein